MRNFLLPILFVLININQLFSQTNLFPATGSAGIGTITPNSSALLDISSTTQGMLVPRMTLAQRTAIIAPATGLLIYQTNSTPGFYYYTGSVWTPISIVDANRNLSNLLATSINQDLVPAATNSRSLGNLTKRWKDIHLYNLRFADGTTQNTAAKIYSAGVGISIGGTVITNTAPDQIVLLNGSGATTISGTYPNFTISSTDNNTTYSAGVGLNLVGTTFENTAPDQTITLTGGGSTSVTGTYPNFTITTPVGGGGWLLSGNTGTIDGTDFIGTTDSAPLNFKVNNQKAGRIDPLSLNTILGFQSGFTTTSGIMNTAIGAQSLFYNTTGGQNTATGVSALLSNTIGNYNTAHGVLALSGNTTGNENTSVGMNSLYQNNIGNNNTAMGLNALYTNTTGSNNTALGYNADVSSGALSNATAIGYNAKVSTSNSLVLGGTGPDAVNVGIGTTNPTSKLDLIGAIKISDGTQGVGKVLTSDANGLASWQTLAASGWLLTGNSGTIDGVNFIGTTTNVPINFKVNNQNAGRVDNTLSNVFFGYKSGNSIATGASNTAIGQEALFSNTISNDNTATGNKALRNNTGGENTATGSQSLFHNSSGAANTAIGYNSLFNNSTGVNNTSVGHNALALNTTGYSNTAIGSGADVLSNNLINATAIGANARVSTSNSLVLGDGFVNVGIGTTAPSAKLEVIGSVKITDGTQGSGKILTSDANGVATWQTPINGWTLTGNSGTIDGTNFIGTTDNIPLSFKVNNQKAGRIDNYYGNAFFGYQSGNSNTTGSANSAIGQQALYSNTEGNWNTANGSYAIFSNTTGQFNTATGGAALYSNTTGNNNSSNGMYSLYFNNTGSNNTANGYQSLFNNTTGNNNMSNGYGALFSNTTGNHNTAAGMNALTSNTTGEFNTAVGYGANVSSGSLTNATAIGANTNVSASNSLILGNGANVGIGTTAPTAKLELIGSIKITDGSQGTGKVLTSDAAGLATWQTQITGWSILGNAGTVDGTNFIGTTDNVPLTFKINNQNAGRIDNGSQNTFIGYQSGNSNSGYSNTAIGYLSLFSNSGSLNTANGIWSLYNNTTGNQNTASGMSSLYNNITGSLNTACGTSSLYNNTTGSQNTAYGTSALISNSTGNNNTAIGYNADVISGALTNATAIGYNAKVAASNSLVLGGTGVDGVNVGIGTTTPTAKLEVNGSIKITDGTQGVGKVLTSDASGLAVWTSNNNWALSGNMGTIDGTNFIGTTDNIPLNFKVNNQKAGRIDQTLLNTFFGYQSGNSNTTGSSNTATGNQALFVNTTGNANTAFGFDVLYSNTSGAQNTAIGVDAMFSNISGTQNTALGYESLRYNTIGTENTAIGDFAIYNNITGYQNSSLGGLSLYLNNSGRFNTATGFRALYSNTTGNYNTALGYLTDVSAGGLNNATTIGYNSMVDASDKVRIGNSSVTSNGGQVGWSTYSDARIKEDVQENVPGMNFINQLRPVTYHYDVTKQNQIEGIADTMQWESKYDIEQIQFTGFIAQEVDAAAKKINYDFSGVDKSGTLMALRYSEFVVPLVQAAQELDSVNTVQDDQMSDLQTMVLNQQSEIDELKSQIDILTSAMNTTNVNDGTIAIGIAENNNALLGQNIPNPYDNTTLIPFRIPKGCKDASIMITNVSEGKVITVIPISCEETHISFEAGELPSGNYTYSLMVDGKIIGTKQMNLIK